eukprot:TRINITY_DN18485_c0_g1_i1.p1 TRINITY_DN18485_c0_g1~~TRINITY_DN18485_c0_g1_i1.p1  ORF type:complete len:280 (+),score=85.07 TRINITY_DN18485_c0_g1_i1:51-890(+)
MPLSQDSPVVLLPDVLEGMALDVLLEEFAAVRASDYECEDNPTALTFGTYWMPTGQAPRNAIEAYVARVQQTDAFQEAAGGVALEGAEWWWQDTDAEGEPKDYHTDCDLHLTTGADGETTNTKVYPAVSSVFYTGCVGGPTVVFDQVTELGDLVPPAPRQVVMSFPRLAQLLLFHGPLWHGVLHPPGAWGDGDRVTLLVNWWTVRPNGPSDLPEEFVFSSPPPCFPPTPLTPALCARVSCADAEEAAAAYEAHRIPADVLQAITAGPDPPRAVVQTWAS